MSDGPRAAMQVCARCGGAGGDPWDGPCTDCRGEGAILVTAEVLHPDGECSRCRHRPHTGVCGYLPDDEVEPYRCQCTLSTRTAASGGTTDGEPAVPVPRFRDQLAEVLHEWMGGDRDYYDVPVDALMPTIAAEVEARVQAAANRHRPWRAPRDGGYHPEPPGQPEPTEPPRGPAGTSRRPGDTR